MKVDNQLRGGGREAGGAGFNLGKQISKLKTKRRASVDCVRGAEGQNKLKKEKKSKKQFGSATTLDRHPDFQQAKRFGSASNLLIDIQANNRANNRANKFGSTTTLECTTVSKENLSLMKQLSASLRSLL